MPSAGGPVTQGDAEAGADKATTPTVGSLGWLGGSGVAIGYNLAQNSGGGPTLTDLALTIYNGTTFAPIVTFHLDAPTTYDTGDRSLQPGNGNGIFGFVLDTAERLQYTALVSERHDHRLKPCRAWCRNGMCRSRNLNLSILQRWL